MRTVNRNTTHPQADPRTSQNILSLLIDAQEVAFHEQEFGECARLEDAFLQVEAEYEPYEDEYHRQRLLDESDKDPGQ